MGGDLRFISNGDVYVDGHMGVNVGVVTYGVLMLILVLSLWVLMFAANGNGFVDPGNNDDVNVGMDV